MQCGRGSGAGAVWEGSGGGAGQWGRGRAVGGAGQCGRGSVSCGRGPFHTFLNSLPQSLDPELEAQLGRIRDTAPKYGLWTKMVVVVGMLHKIYRIDSLVDGFFENFNKHYSDAVDTDFYSLSLTEQVDFVRHLYKVGLVG